MAEGAQMALQQEAAALGTQYDIEISSRVLPQLDDGATLAPANLQGYTGYHAGQTRQIDITRWLTAPPQGAWGQFGLSLGMNTPSAAATALAQTHASVQPTSLDLGMRWRSRLESGRRLDIAAWARAPQWSQPQDAMNLIWQSRQPVYGTRVEVQWASSRTRGLVPEFGAIGVQLQGGSRLVLRARKGGPMLYYRAKF